MIKLLDQRYLDGVQQGLSLKVFDFEQSREGLNDEQIYAVLRVVLSGLLRERGKDPAFWSFVAESERDAATRRTDYVVVASPEGM